MNATNFIPLRMDAALLRIKFTPLLKRINNRGDPDSKCCIEIVPELSAFQNLEKLHWKLENNLIEYTIPMTYKILIQKQDNAKNQTDPKIYHSCVDLLSTSYSMSDANFASGDIARITSDNFFLRRISSIDNNCGVLMNKHLINSKELMNAKDLIESIITQKSTSIQTLNIYEQRSSLCIQRPLKVDKSFDIHEISDNDYNKKSNHTIVPNMYSFIELTKKCRGIAYVEEETFTEDDNKSECVDAHLDGTASPLPYRQLTLSPICSIDTTDVAPMEKVYYRSNTFSFAVISNLYEKSDFTETEPTLIDNDVDQGMKNFFLNKSKRIQHDRHTQHRDNITQDVRIKALDERNSNSNVANKATFMRKKISNKNIMKRNSLHKFEPQNNKVNKCNIIDVAKKNPKMQRTTFNDQNKISITNKESLLGEFAGRTNGIVCNIDNNQTKSRILPEVRVAKFVQNLENEIYPLKLMLNEIKCKCLMLGIYRGDFMPMTQTKSIIYKQIPDFETQKSVVTETCKKTAKSNRVVYSILFNG